MNRPIAGSSCGLGSGEKILGLERLVVKLALIDTLRSVFAALLAVALRL